MCRHYHFRFSECGHTWTCLQDSWVYQCDEYPICEDKDITFDSPTYCFNCLLQPSMPSSTNTPYPELTPAEVSKAHRIFSFVQEHKLQFPNDPQPTNSPAEFSNQPLTFSLDSIRALMKHQTSPRLQPGDLLWVQLLDQALESVLWRDRMANPQNDPGKPPFFNSRLFVLQLRWVHFSAGIQEQEITAFREELLGETYAWIEHRKDSRIRKLCCEVNAKELEEGEGEECPICYTSFLELSGKGEDGLKPVKLPCGHKFCRGCIEAALRAPSRGEYEQTCPACRTDFGLKGQMRNDVKSARSDRNDLRDELVDMVPVPIESPSWMVMLREEMYS